MKTTLFTLEFPPQTGGVAKYYGALAQNWQPASDFSVILAANLTGPQKYRQYIRQLQREYHRGTRNFIAGQILPLGTALYLYSLIKKIDYSVILHGLDFSLATKNPWRRYLSRKILRRAKQIICANSYTQKQVQAFLLAKESHIFVVNPGVSAPKNGEEIALVAKKLKDKYQIANQRIIFSLGRLVKRKGFDNLIAAWQEIKTTDSDSLLVIAGSGPEEAELKKMAGDERRIIFLGKIAETEKWAWLEIADIFALPARDLAGDYEGFGIVYLEAGLAGKAVLAGRTGGVEDAVIDNQTGVLVNGEKREEIAAALLKLLADQNWREKLGTAGKRRAEIDFSEKIQASKIQKILSL
ncbi:MAG TPA: glycosyltransferase family 4 protein [bacterium]|nr:glycosyltransferase family 4 protein [bacterium]